MPKITESVWSEIAKKRSSENSAAKSAKKRGYRRKNPMMQIATAKNKRGKSHYNITCATNESLYLLINLEAMMDGKSVSSLVEEMLMARYGERIKNFEVAFSNLRKLEGR